VNPEPLSVEWLDAQLALAAQAVTPQPSLDALLTARDNFMEAAEHYYPLLAGVLRDILVLCDEDPAKYACHHSLGYARFRANVLQVVERHRDGS
jgi:hypothetical protein